MHFLKCNVNKCYEDIVFYVNLIFFSRFEIDMWEEKLVLPTEDEMARRSKGVDGIYTFGPQAVTKKIMDAAGSNFVTTFLIFFFQD